MSYFDVKTDYNKETKVYTITSTTIDEAGKPTKKVVVNWFDKDKNKTFSPGDGFSLQEGELSKVEAAFIFKDYDSAKGKVFGKKNKLPEYIQTENDNNANFNLEAGKEYGLSSFVKGLPSIRGYSENLEKNKLNLLLCKIKGINEGNNHPVLNY